MRKYIIIAFVFFVFFASFSQATYITIVDKEIIGEDGVFYSTVVDAENKIWLASELGVFEIHYDNSLIRLNKNKLVDDVFDLYADSRGNIWFSSYASYLQFLTSKKELVTIDSIGGYAQRFIENNTGGVFFQNHLKGIGFFNEQNQEYKQKLNSFSNVGSIIDLNDTSFLVRVSNFFYITDNDLNIISEERLLSNIIPSGIRYEGLPLAKLYLKEKIGYNKLLELSKLPVNSIHLSKDHKYVIILIDSVEVYSFENGFDKQKSRLLSSMNFNVKNFASFFEDKEQNIWLTKIREGVFQVPYYYKNFNNDYFEIFKEESIRNIDKVVFKDDFIFLIDTVQKFYFKKSIGITIKKIKKRGDDFILIDKEGIHNFLFNTKTNTHKEIHDKDFIIDILPYDKDYFFLLKKKNVEIAKIEGNNFKTKVSYNFAHPTSVLLVNDSILLVGTVEGLYELNLMSNKQSKIDSTLGHITQIARFNNNILIGTFNRGLLKFDLKSKKSTQILRRVHKIYSFSINNEEQILINSEKGIFLITGANFDNTINLTEELRELDNNHIFFLDDKNCLSILNEKVISYNFNHKYPKIDLKVSSIKANKKYFREDNQVNLDYTQNTIKFNLHCNTLSYFDNVNFYYKLKGIDSNFVQSELPVVSYKDLPPNKYNFEAYVTSRDGNVKSNIVNITVIINSPFWDLWWFKILVVIFSFLIIYLIHRLRLRIRLKKETLQKEIYESKLNNIKAQVNPHFFSNALVGVQQLFIEGRELEANEYIAKLGRLSRKIISSSNELVWPLLNEMTLLKDYCDIETERFKSKIHIIINAEENIDREKILIPTMLIQPLIENSIKHGINENEELIIQINFKIHHEKLIVNVEDNGVGINTKQNNKLKEGTGLKMFKKKIDLVNEQYNINITYKVITKPIIKGTNFIIELPTNYE